MGAAALVSEPSARGAGARATAAVRADRFGKRFGASWALRDVSFDVRAGEMFGVTGADGAGKSSLLKSIAGVLAFEAGTIDVLGVSMGSERSAERAKARLGFMPQGLGQNLYPELSVDENVSFFARLRLVPAAERAERTRRLLAMARLERFGDRPAKQLSGGMRQKLALVCTLIHEPELLILDEPTTGVDPVSRRAFWAMLAELTRERGMTAIVSTSYLNEVERFDRVAHLHRRTLLAVGTPMEMRAEREPERAPAAVTQAAPARAVGAPWRAPGDGARGEAPVLVEARSLVRDFGRFRAVDGVSFRVRAGEIVGLLGANGAGKTTVIKMLTGLIAPTAGSAYVTGADMRRAARVVRQRIGYMSQAFSLYHDLTVAENIRLYAGIYGLDRRLGAERAAWVTEMAGLAGNERALAGRLPVGLRQRLALGCALVHRPVVLFLDEPTAGVDAAGRRRFWDILLALAREERVAVLLTTHYMTEAEDCDRVVLIHAGRVAAEGAPRCLEAESERVEGGLLDVETDSPRLALEALRRAGYGDAELLGARVQMATRDPPRDERRVRDELGAAGIAVRAIRRSPLTLDDVFVRSVAAEERAERGAPGAASGGEGR